MQHDVHVQTAQMSKELCIDAILQKLPLHHA
jgi:hypothetical protein